MGADAWIHPEEADWEETSYRKLYRCRRRRERVLPKEGTAKGCTTTPERALWGKKGGKK